MKKPWTPEVVMKYFDEIGLEYNSQRLHCAVVCVLETKIQYPHMTRWEILEMLYPFEDYGCVPSPS